MFLLSLLLTAVLCIPVISNHLNHLEKTKTAGFLSNTEDKMDKLIESLKNLITDNYFEERQSILNKSYSIHFGDYLGLFKNMSYEETVKSNHGSKHDFETNVAGDIDKDNDRRGLNMLLSHLFDYTVEGIDEILSELIYAIGEDADKDKNHIQEHRDMFKARLQEIEELLEVGNITVESGQILKRPRSFSDIPTEISNISKYLDDGIMDSGHENMLRKYEARGAICVLIKEYSEIPIYVISTCNLRFPRTNLWYLCERKYSLSTKNYILETPVQDQEGFVYKNVYCAQCNNATEIYAWTTKIDCDEVKAYPHLSDMTDLLNSITEFTESRNGCKFRLSPAEPHMIQQCYNIDVSNERRPHRKLTEDNEINNFSNFPLPLSILINFGFNGKKHVLLSSLINTHTSQILCNKNEKYDKEFKKCRRIHCLDGYQLEGETCEKIASNDPHYKDLSDIDKPMNVILTIKNVTYGDIHKLKIAYNNGLVTQRLAHIVDISVSRIQNLTMGSVNAKELRNRSGSVIELHRLTMPRLFKIFSKLQQAETNLTQTMGKISTKFHSTADNGNGSRQTGLATKKTLSPIIVFYDEMFQPENHEAFSKVENETEEVTNNNIKLSKREKLKRKPFNASDRSNDQSQFKQKPNRGVIIETNNLLTRSRPPCMSISISFVLTPARKNRTLQKSVHKVVQSMSNLINSDTFSLNISGVNFKVHEVENTPQGISVNNVCKYGRLTILNDTEFYYREYENETIIIENETGDRYFPQEFNLSIRIEFRSGNLSRIEKNSTVCKMPKISNVKCGRIVLYKHEYKLFKNKSIEFENSLYNMSEYEYVNIQEGVVSICTTPGFVEIENACYDDLFKVVIAESYLTFILGVISLICMLSVLVTYGLFNKLRNLPGVNTMNLTFSLFMGELVFITSGWIRPYQIWLCSAVGMVLHYLFLAAFFWMNVMSFDVFRTFGNKCILKRVRKKRKYLPRYLLYAWGSPFLIVTLCGVLDYTDLVKGVKMEYGGNFVSNAGMSPEHELENTSSSNNSSSRHVSSIGCWIQQPLASMAAFGGPMILILIGNTVMFIRTIICIRASTKGSRLSVWRPSLKRLVTGRDDVMLYVRMSSVMGFTWVFGLASSVYSAVGDPTSRTTCIVLHIFGILFIVFNCSQGIFIFFVFLLNRRVLAMYRTLFGRIKNKKSIPMSVNSRATLNVPTGQLSLTHIA